MTSGFWLPKFFRVWSMLVNCKYCIYSSTPLKFYIPFFFFFKVHCIILTESWIKKRTFIYLHVHPIYQNERDLILEFWEIHLLVPEAASCITTFIFLSVENKCQCCLTSELAATHQHTIFQYHSPSANLILNTSPLANPWGQHASQVLCYHIIPKCKISWSKYRSNSIVSLLRCR